MQFDADRKIILVDFDGVLHSYISPWAGADKVLDPPVDGAVEWLRELLLDENLRVCIYSSRNQQEGGIEAMKQWLGDNDLDDNLIEQIEFPTQKPPAFLTIDDRVICFNGIFPSVDDIKNFQPWNKRGI